MINGFGITGFRSFGPDPQFLHPLEKINLIVGRNNSGKSNVLRLVKLLESYSREVRQFSRPIGLDSHIGRRGALFTWRLPIEIDDAGVTAVLKRLFGESPKQEQWRSFVGEILHALPDADEVIAWITIENFNEWNPKIPSAQEVLKKMQKSGKNPELQRTWYSFWNALTNQSQGSFDQHHGPEVLKRLIECARPEVAKVSLLNAHRKIGDPGSSPDGINGQGLISRLLELQNPELSLRKESLEKFQRINSFLSQVLEAEDAKLEIPHSGKELNVSMGDRVLPIDSLGTGVHEVIIFAAAATAIENEILCIEEPEIHLHPRLQRQLLKYLHEKTNNQYFITTHSPCLLDSPNSAVFHISLNKDNETEIRKLTIPTHRAAIGFDLGYRASDLVQANAIIWVEGPSDRIYLNAWIQHIDPELSEGLHYSIMFYGGRLLSHLSADDTSVSDFISLQRLNRNIAIVIDSDRRRPSSQLNRTKQRVLDETERSSGFGWVTAGREIENYITSPMMDLALTKVHPSTIFKKPRSQWDCSYEADNNKNFSADKIAIARSAVSSINLDILDLEPKIQSLIRFIRAANY